MESARNNLKSIYSLAEYPPFIYSNTFNNVDKSIPVYIYKGTKAAYKAADGWCEFTNFVETDFTGIKESEISAPEIKIVNGKVTIPDRPGIGVLPVE